MHYAIPFFSVTSVLPVTSLQYISVGFVIERLVLSHLNLFNARRGGEPVCLTFNQITGGR